MAPWYAIMTFSTALLAPAPAPATDAPAPAAAIKRLRDLPAMTRLQAEQVEHIAAAYKAGNKSLSELDGKPRYIASAGVGLVNSAL
ncbi:uncharacterized protein MAM_03598 [Metarhizium album ARSEF 1941]|uniref:Uncharacterized protein n=1 Tax=Metarhizium album (strain ARSEF 1941) TaxID=1081103 RepID=A0A0B2WY01_METAS|nr:uncharacterized protein MAM_03598 [Metarhizium album ARSEF 1941]KHN98474.1 hypothetical protein MAM_03598 [Metarhizium album ARSEF 1941]